MKVSHTFATKLTKDSANSIETKAVFDFAQVTPEEMTKLAVRSVTIMQQAAYREAGKIPSTDNVDVRKLLDSPRGGFKLTPEGLANKASTDEVTMRATLKALNVSEKEIEKIIAAKFPKQATGTK